MDNQPLVSVIIPTKNEAKHIANCIKSILSQTYPKNRIEIIVVDNNSSDKTVEIARQYTDKVFDKGPERSAQRNYGMLEKAQGKYVMYLDADMVLDEQVIEDCVKRIESENQTVALYISEIVMGDKFWSKVRRFERSFYDATVIDCVRFIQRDKFIQVGGFDESLTGPEDWDLDKKLRNIGKVGLIKTPIYHNEAEFNFKKYLSKKGYYAKSFDKYIAKWGKDDPDIKKQFGMYYRFFGVFVEKGKWRKIIRHPVLAYGIFALRLFVGLQYLITQNNISVKKHEKGILILTPFFSPNIGGVETHFDDLVTALDNLGYKIFVHTYSPITTKNVKWQSYEKRGRNIVIKRYKWFGKNIFHKVEKFPFFDFLYLTPYLFCRTLIWLSFNHKKINLIHAQGFNAAIMGVVFKKIFKKRLIVSTHAVYEIEKGSSTVKKITSILKQADKVLTLSKSSFKELVSYGLNDNKMDLFKYWINLEILKPLDKTTTKKELGMENKFFVFFVGRLIEKKGVRVLVDVALGLPDINFVFIGTGPLEQFLYDKQKTINNLEFLGSMANNQLYKYYNSADIFCIPSQYEEGFGRVVMEAVACGLPVVGSDKGGIPEALDQGVSILVDPTVENLKKAIEKLYLNKKLYWQLSQNCRKYAEKNFSERNIGLITKYY